MRPGFAAIAGAGRLPDLVRYVTGIDLRLARLPENPARDARGMAEVAAIERQYIALLDALGAAVPPAVVDLGWQLEELRVSTFAQSLGAARGISAKRLAAEIGALRNR